MKMWSRVAKYNSVRPFSPGSVPDATIHRALGIDGWGMNSSPSNGGAAANTACAPGGVPTAKPVIRSSPSAPVNVRVNAPSWEVDSSVRSNPSTWSTMTSSTSAGPSLCASAAPRGANPMVLVATTVTEMIASTAWRGHVPTGAHYFAGPGRPPAMSLR